jgi:iron complex transport system substrate-binding protein
VKNLLTIAAFGCLCIFIAGCGDRPAPAEVVNADNTASLRVVVLAPAAAEMLEAFDLLELVVGIGDFGPWPARIQNRPSVGGYSAPNVERILELECDLLITTESVAASPAHARLESIGVRVVPLDTSTYEGVFESLAAVGSVFDRQAQAEQLQRTMRKELDALATLAVDLPRRKVLFVVGRDPVYVAGPGSHIDELITLVGGVNIAHDALSPYQLVSLEAILERMPDVIIDTSDNRPQALRGREVGSWGEWEFLPAVEHRRVYWIEPGRLVIPGIRLPEMAELTGKLIHPEIFGEPTPEQMGPYGDHAPGS